MTPYRICGQLVYINDIESLEEYVTPEIYEVIEDLFNAQDYKYDTIREVNQELESDIEDFHDTFRELRDMCDKFIHEIHELTQLRKTGILSRFEKLRSNIEEAMK